MPFVKNDPRINRQGRPPIGQSFADRVRSLVGADGAKLADLWFAVAYGLYPERTKASSRVTRIEQLEKLHTDAGVADRILCSRLLAERGFGKPKETQEHTGDIRIRWQG